MYCAQVYSCGIDDIADFPHKEDERRVKWGVRDSDGVISTCSLRFKDRHNADNFVKIVQKESSLKTISNDNEDMSSVKVDADHRSDNAPPDRPISDRDDDIPLASDDADTHKGSIADDHSKDNDQVSIRQKILQFA